MFSLSLWVLVGAYWGVGSWWALVFVVCWGAWLLCGVRALGCLVNLGGVCVAVLLRPGAVLGCGAAWDRGLWWVVPCWPQPGGGPLVCEGVKT